MSHKSGHIIINSMIPQDGEPLVCLLPQEVTLLMDIRDRDEYTINDRVALATIVAMRADEPAE